MEIKVAIQHLDVVYSLVLKQMAILLIGSQFERIPINLYIVQNHIAINTSDKTTYYQVSIKRNHKKQLKSKNYLQNQIKPLVKSLCNKKQANKLLY